MPEAACRSKGSYTHPCAIFVRLTEEEHRALRRLIKKRHLTIQAFSHAAIMRALNEANLGKETAAEEKLGTLKKTDESTPPAPTLTRGLGIRERLEAEEESRREREDEPEHVVERPSAVTQFIAPAPAPSSADVHMLARTIVELPQASRRDAVSAAVRSIAHGRSQDEALRMAEDLDREIRRLDARPATALERVRARRRSKR